MCAQTREDGAYKLNIAITGSLQNPAWSPDGKLILFTRFRGVYNKEPADLLILNLETNSLKTLVSDGSGNINLSGSCWNMLTSQIVFASTREPHDEIFVIHSSTPSGMERKITNRKDKVSYEPSLSPDGKWITFESHSLDAADNGIIMKYKIDGSSPYQSLTDANEDCRQPNWSSAGDLILYQRLSQGQWDIWVTNIEGTHRRKVTSGTGNKTDAAFSPNGQWIIYSTEAEGTRFANLFMIPVAGGTPIRVTRYSGYDGAPSWSPDAKKIAFESCPEDPETSNGTSLWIIDVPK